ncbi:T9SS type B sorting domain-containing protein [Chitinophaga arvensicola]|nr:gliding motility-associated C-terminal domain-containing protein [Chitinophaga arvensicola]
MQRSLSVLVLLGMLTVSKVSAQQCTGSLGDPVFKETFGQAATAAKPTLGGPLPAGITTYAYYSPAGASRPTGPYPGQYTISNTTRGYNNTYFVDRPDHTSTDGTGYCMVVDAEASPGKFYERTITGLCAGTTFEFSAWIMNINPQNGVSKPSLRFDIVDANNPNGTPITSVSTGEVSYSAPGTWVRQAGIFQMPATTSSVILRIYSNTPNSNGNDLALDDIAFAACGPPITFTQAAGVVCSGASTSVTVSLPAGSYSTYFFQLQKRALGATDWVNEGGVINNQGNNQHTFQVTNAQAGFEYRVVAAGGQAEINNLNCRVVSTPIELKVIDFTVAISGQQPICYNTAATLTATVTPKAGTGTPTTGFTYLWETSTNGTAWTTVAGQTGATLNTGALTASRYYRVTATVSGCQGDGVSQSFLVNVSPQITATLGAVTNVCAGTVLVNLPYTITSGTPNQYSIVSTDLPGFVPVTNMALSGSPVRITIPAGAAPGTYHFTISFRNSTVNCSSALYPFTLVIDAPPTTAVAGPDQELCAVTSTTLAGNVATVGVGTWTQISGPNTAVFADNHNNATTVSGLTTGTYQFRWGIANGTCLATSSIVRITVIPAPTKADAGPDQTQYNTGAFNMTANAPAVGTGRWALISGTAVVSNPTNPRTLITLNPNTTATLAWIISNGVCPPDSDLVVLRYRSEADIRVTKTVLESGPYLSGQDVDYEMVVANIGPSNATNVHVVDAIPASIQVKNIIYATTGAAQILQNNSTNNKIDLNASIPVGNADVYIIVHGKILSSFEGTITNEIDAVSLDQVDANGATAISVISAARRPFFDAIKTAPSTAVAGEAIKFSLVVENEGLGDAQAAVITDVISSKLSNVSWSAVSTGKAVITSGATGTGNNLRLVADFPADTGKVYISITGTVNADATGNILNTATVTPTETTVPPVNSNTTNTLISSSPGLLIDKARTGAGPAIAGEKIDYVLTLMNNGPSNAVGTVITDTVPAAIQNVTWTSTVQGAAVVTAGASGSGSRISVTGNVPAGASNRIIVHVTGTVSPDYAGIILNRAVATPAEPGIPPVTDIDLAVVQKSLKLSIQKSGPATAVAGEQISYTVDVTNQGPSNATNATIRDVVSPALYNVSWTAAVLTGTGVIRDGATGNKNLVVVSADINAGATIRVIITGTILPPTFNPIHNTAQVIPIEAGIPPVNSNEVVTTINRQSALSITKVGPDTASAGAIITYTIKAVNNGPSNARALTIKDIVPATINGVIWNAVANGNASISGASAGVGNNIALTADIAAGNINNITITVRGKIDPTFSGQINNKAVVTPAPGEGTADSSTKVTTVTRLPQLAITKSAADLILAGDTVTYTIEVTNQNTADAQNLVVTDVVPAEISGVQWSAVAQGAATISGNASGSGNNIRLTGSIPGGLAANKLIITVKGKVSAALEGIVRNTATATPSEAVPPVSATKVVRVRRIPTLSISKSGPATLSAGEAIVYTIIVRNTGLSDAINLIVDDQIPAAIQQTTWTATASGNATIIRGATGTGNTLNLDANINGGGNNFITITVNGIVDPAFSGSFTNSAVYQPSEAGATPGVSNPVVTTVVQKPNVKIRKSGPAAASAGDQITYRLQVTNLGPSNALNTVIADNLPQILNATSWTATASGGASISTGATGTGNLLRIVGSVPAKTGVIDIIITATIPAAVTAPSITNFAGVAPAEPGIPPVNSDTVVTVLSRKPGLLISKIGPSTAHAGEPIVYGVKVINVGPSDAVGAIITDTIPSTVLNANWIATASGGASITAGARGAGNIVRLTTNIPVGEANFINIVVAGVIKDDLSGTLVNKATVAAAEPGIPPVSSQVNTLVTRKAVLHINKSGPASLTAGNPIRYNVDVTNNGPGSATNVTIKDVIPAGIINATWTATAINGAVINSGNTGTGNILLQADIPNTSLAAIRIQVDGKVDPDYNATTITNTAIALNDPSVTPVGDTASVLTTVSRLANLRIVKSGPANQAAGEPVEYTLRIQNAGPSNATGVQVTDVLPAQLLNTSWTTSFTGNVKNISPAAGNGNVSLTADIPADSSTLLVTIKGIMSPAVANGSTVINTATTGFPGGSAIVDPNLLDNTSSVQTVVDNDPVVRIAKSGPAITHVGDSIQYNVVITNGGSGNITGAQIEDLVPAAITVASWNASATGIATVTGAVSGTTNTVQTTADIPVGNNSIVIVIRGIVNNTAGTTITNTASVTAGSHKESSVTTSVDKSTDVSIVKSGPQRLFAGEAVSYTIQVFNAGPNNADDLVINDQIPAAITGVAWNAIVTGNATVLGGNRVDSTGNNINIPATIAAGPGNYITFTVTGTVSGGTPSGNLTNTANVTVNGVTDYNPANNTSSVTTLIGQATGVQVRKSGPAQAVSGNAITYNVVVTNSGPSDATGLNILDVVPAQVRNTHWEVTVNGAAAVTGPFSGDNNNINTTVNIPGGAGNNVTILVTGTLNDDFDGTILNRVTVSGTGIPSVSDSVSTVVNRETGLSIRKYGPATITAGDKITYVLTLTNSGPGYARNIALTDTIDSRIQQPVWTTQVINGATINTGASGTGNHVALNADIPATGNAQVIVTVTGVVAPDASGTLINAATATPPDPGNPPVVSPPVITVIENHPELTVIKNGPTAMHAGETIHYLLQITNNGLSKAVNALITDVVPATISQVQWNVVSVNGGAVVNSGNTGTGNNVRLTADVPAAANITIAIQGVIDSTFAGSLPNTAIVTPAEPGNTPDSSNIVTTVTLQPGVKISKTGPAALHSGENISYTIVAGNDGPSAAVNAHIHDMVPAAVTNVVWSASASGNAVINGAVTGSGNAIDLLANIPAGNSNRITITVNGTVDPAFRDTLKNTAIITPSEAGAKADSSELVQTVITATPQLDIQKTGPATVIAGQPISYTITTTNTGLSDALNLSITDQVPASVTGVQWQAVANGLAVINGANSGNTNNISLTGNLPAGSNNIIVITVSGVVAGNTTGIIVNEATVTPSEAGVAPKQSRVNTSVITDSRVLISKTGDAIMTRGDKATYVIIVANPGPSNAAGLKVTDAVPDVLTNVSWTATPLRSAVISTGATGTGNSVNIMADLPAADTSGLRIVVTGTVKQDAPAGTVTNTAHVILSSGKDIPSGEVVSIIGSNTDLSITKTGPSEVYEGSRITYQLTVNNAGPSDANGATVQDILPTGLSQPAISVVSTTGGAAGIQAVLNGNTANASAATFPAGASFVLQITGIAPLPGTLSNTAVVNTPAGIPDADSSNNISNTIVTTVLGKNDLKVTKTVSPAAGPYSVGQKVIYTLNVTNNGTAGVNPVVVTDQLPPASQLGDPVYSAPAKGTITFDPAQRVIVWNVGLLNAGETQTWSYEVTITGPGRVQNTAIITGPPDVSTPDTSVVTITTDRYANLKVMKKLNTLSPLHVNQELQFVVTAINNGPDSATGVILRDAMESMLGQPISMITTKGLATFDPITKTITWQIPEMANGTQETLTFTVKLISGGTLTNTANITGNETDVDLSDNTATVTQEITGEDIFLPNIITPNGDGKNDYFVVPGLDRYPGSTLLIYNRWGNQVYQNKNYDNKWNGDGLNEGTYYYILKIRSAQVNRDLKGWIELLR